MACARETRSWDLLLLLCVLRVGAEEQQTEVVGTVGESAVLHCFFKLPPNFPLDRLRVYWQTPDDKVVYALLSGANGDEFQASEYQGRARLWQEKLQEGDFSLLLSNLRLDDSQTYRCIVLMNETKFEMKDQSSITLSVGASYRQPNQSSPELSEVEFGEEVTFNCSSSKGYPEPKVHWTDAFKSSLPPHSVSFERDLDHFSVFSMLRLNATSDLNLSCIIENQLLQENVTARQFVLKVRNNSSLPIGHRQTREVTRATVGICVPVVIVVFNGAAIWLYRKKFFNKFYKGVQVTEARAEQELEMDSSNRKCMEDVSSC
ncbi:CD276 antigen-like isoform X2 [Rhinatrema bivittatum]|uniref:CD276 antigen-like isoform X2 n=1 Tax=Rhinatrema bivittatum TaxID=194408 RepID=UPI001129AA6E|nr:CD276 antigen-like isoform X2 [Rhinatrema bivittatum]